MSLLVKIQGNKEKIQYNEESYVRTYLYHSFKLQGNKVKYKEIQGKYNTIRESTYTIQ